MERQFELLGGIDRFVRPGDRVLLKPNFIAPKSREHATQTHPAFVLEVARLLKDFGAKPFVGDSPAWSNVATCVKVLKLDGPLKELSVPVKQLDKPRWVRVGAGKTKVGISSVALDADVVINLPKLKSHQQLLTTFAIKNMFGCASGKQKAFWHFAKGRNTDRFCKLLADIYRFVNPALTIVDAIYAMDGAGPINGRTRPLGWLIGGTDPVACETVCCKIINIDPVDVPVLKAARCSGLGSGEQDKIEIVGDDLAQNVCTDFELPDLIPLSFSLMHVCKSVLKQMLLLANSVKTRLITADEDRTNDPGFLR
ncbi:MAG: DUF362 domain-containing protein [Phycisphaerales bacterium]|nr:MAG: DUF362 domain-containing protein [Phycisphaerales bacterium]